MRGFKAICLLALASGTGCSSIMLDNPHAAGFAGISIASDKSQRGPDWVFVRIIEIKTASGIEERDFPGEKPAITSLYLKAGTYTVQAVCERNWPNPSTDESTYQLPHGLGTDDTSETFTISVETDKSYILDCEPGKDKSEFKLIPVVLG